MNLSVEELCRDISALSLEQKPQSSPKKSAKGATSEDQGETGDKEQTEQ